IAFRDTGGRVGIFDHRCPHRCASLFLGRNEDHGLRCAYHGWKFDVDGNCLDQPNLPDKNKYPAGVKAKAYKTTERGGMVFVYMGERAEAPPFPEIEAAVTSNPDDTATYTVLNKAPQIHVSEMPFGTMYSASRAAMEGHEHHRFACFIFPFW